MTLRHVLSTAALCALSAASASAQESGMRQLGAHVHGAAELIAAADPDGLVVAELYSAAWNLYGFESAAASEAQRETVAAVAARLVEPGLVAFPEAAGCVLTETTVMGGPSMGADHGHGDHDHKHDDHGHDHDDHGDHEHEHEHEHEHDHDHAHDDHGHDHGDQDHAHDHGDGHTHSDVVVNWTFQCETPAALAPIDLAGLFTAFDRLERVELQYLDADGAAAGQLTPAAPRLGLD
ncbi:MAG: ZrgA family zinc uptake protein [Oceanicaulis sp.]